MKKIVLILLSLVLVLGVFTVGIMAQDQAEGLQVGAARVSITPDLNDSAYASGIHLQGNDWRNRVADSVDENNQIYATCIALQEGDETVLLFSMDLKLITDNFSTSTVNAISTATGVPTSNILLCATHTHSSVAVRYSWTGVSTYRTLVKNKAVEAAQAAIADLGEVSTISAGSTETANLAYVRHYLLADGTVGGPNFGTSSKRVSHVRDAQQDLQLVKIERADKQDLVLMNFGAHATFEDGTTISADYPGYARQRVESRLDNTMAVFFAGTIGDQVPTSSVSTADTTVCEDYGNKLGDYAVAAINSGLTELTDNTMRLRSHTYTVNSNKLGVTDENVAKAQQVVDLMNTGDVSGADTLAKELGFYGRLEASGLVTRSNMPVTQSLELRVMAIGELGFALAPYEMFGQNGAYIKANSPYANTFVTSCSGNQKSYIATIEAFDYNDGRGSYEAQQCYFERGTGEAMAENFVALLSQSQIHYCSHCGKDISAEEWKPWDIAEGEVAAGHYYLSENYMAQTDMITVPKGTEVCLDLRGNTYVTEDIRVFSVNGTLSVMDSVGGGVVLTTGENSANNAGAFASVGTTGQLDIYGGTVQFVEREDISITTGGLIYVNKGTVNIHGGTLRGGVVRGSGTATVQGGNIFMTGGNLNITGGTVTGGMALKGETTGAIQGGNVYALSGTQISISGEAVVSNGYSAQDGGNFYIASAHLTLSGGTISGGHAVRNGGNIRQTSSSDNSITITGGKITGGVAAGTLADLSSGSTTARSGGGGGNMYVSSAAGALTISGGEITGDIRVDNIKEMTLSGAPKIGMGKSNGLMFVNGMKADVSGLTEGAEIYVWAEKAFTKDLADETAATAASAYFKGVIRTVVAVDGLALKGTQGTSGTEGYCPHCGNKVAWYVGFTATANQVHRYLTQNDIGTTGNKTIPQDVVLDLNGFAYQRTTGRILFSTASKSLSVLDSYGGGRIESTGAGNSSSGFIYVYTANTTLNLYSGTLKRNVGTATSVVVKGGVVQVGIDTAKLNIYGGVITGGTITATADGGGNIYLPKSAKLTMEGGIIKDGNAAAGPGGNIYSKGGTNSITIKGGFILNGTTTGNGGNIYSLGKVTLSGGTVAHGSAGNGGNLHLDSASVTHELMKGTIVGGKATKGGNIYQAASTKINLNTQVLCGTASTGGNIYVTGGTLNVNSGALVYGGISNGTAATDSGGNIMATGAAAVTVNGGTLANGTTLHRGGNFYLDNASGSFTLKNNGKVLGGSATVCGGNIATNKAAVINLDSGIVTGGTSDVGPNVCLYNCAATLNIGDATVTGGIYGGIGIVRLSGSARVINEEGTYTGNIAFLADGKLYVSNDFTGEASVSLGSSCTYGDVLPDTKGECGTANDDGTFTATGSYTGKLVYEGLSQKPWILGMDGTLVIGTTKLIGRDESIAWFADNASAVAAYNPYATAYMLPGQTDLVLAGGDYTVDLAGKELNITGTGTVTCFDSANDTYEAFGSATIDGPTLENDTMTQVGDKQYVKLENNGVYTFHRLDMRVNGVSVRPAVTGIYYTCVWTCDSTLQSSMKSFGVAVSTANMPKEDFRTDGDTLWTTNTPETFVSGATKNSVLIQNILKEDATNNSTRGSRRIYATPYMILDDGTEAGIPVVSSQQIRYSLKDTMKLLDQNKEIYYNNMNTLEKLYTKWQSAMSGWGFQNIGKDLSAGTNPGEDDTLQILMVGNSFCYYYVEELYGLLMENLPDGVSNVEIYNLYYSGCSLTRHYDWWTSGSGEYELFKTDANGRKNLSPTKQWTLENALAQGNWDYISLQGTK